MGITRFIGDLCDLKTLCKIKACREPLDIMFITSQYRYAEVAELNYLV